MAVIPHTPPSSSPVEAKAPTSSVDDTNGVTSGSTPRYIPPKRFTTHEEGLFVSPAPEDKTDPASEDKPDSASKDTTKTTTDHQPGVAPTASIERTPQDKLTIAPIEKIVNTTWLMLIDGRLWPVVICDETTAPRMFLHTKKIKEWIPLIVLGRRQYKWASPDQLQEYVDGTDYLQDQPSFLHDTEIVVGDLDSTNLLRKRYKAFTLDVTLHRTASEWFVTMKNYMAIKLLKREKDKELTPKRKYYDEDDDPTMVTPSKAIKLEEEPQSSSKKGKPGSWNSQGPNYAGAAIDPDAEDESLNRLVRDKLHRANGKPWKQAKFEWPTPEHCYDILLDGPGSLHFRISANAIDQCDVLANAVQQVEGKGSIVNIAGTDILPANRGQQLIDVMEYLESGDFVPRIITTGINAGSIEITEDQEKQDHAAQHIAYTFYDAGELELESLQKLCLNKIFKLDPSRLGIMRLGSVLLSSKTTNPNMRRQIFNWISDHITKHFWFLMSRFGDDLARALHADYALQAEVFRKMFLSTGYEFKK